MQRECMGLNSYLVNLVYNEVQLSPKAPSGITRITTRTRLPQVGVEMNNDVLLTNPIFGVRSVRLSLMHMGCRALLLSKD